MGPEELAECNLSSPRTGTPVKLLGREDASVDWYNLEKSKRVKAFRCGEFDDCIERAESAQGMPTKKREKYARREDAILHALELEKQLLKKQVKSSATADHQRSKLSGHTKKDPGIASEGFWAQTAPLKRKLPSSGDSDGSMIPMADNHFQFHPVGSPNMERTNYANGADEMGAISRAKRSRCVYFPADSSDSLDDKELTPNQIKMLPPKFEIMMTILIIVP
ncbi:hypothetical protein GH714_020092 [Hevea brasiliensis]|uniref:Uncharacterized protein n=1 Tax=Hevea brasiliensis TaxID=3981 RepID=A0A6A6LYW1_HEVBR|nr:hypothetical protein GH714_020092 [Hevea brasiliensis]